MGICGNTAEQLRSIGIQGGAGPDGKDRFTIKTNVAQATCFTSVNTNHLSGLLEQSEKEE